MTWDLHVLMRAHPSQVFDHLFLKGCSLSYSSPSSLESGTVAFYVFQNPAPYERMTTCYHNGLYGDEWVPEGVRRNEFHCQATLSVPLTAEPILKLAQYMEAHRLSHRFDGVAIDPQAGKQLHFREAFK